MINKFNTKPGNTRQLWADSEENADTNSSQYKD